VAAWQRNTRVKSIREAVVLVRGSITTWICRLESDEELAFARLHQRLRPLLLTRARNRLKHLPIRFADSDDVVQETFLAFHKALKAGKVPRLSDRNELLAFLTHVIACKACNLIEAEGAEKRGGFRVKDEAALHVPQEGSMARVLEQFHAGTIDVDQKAILDDCYTHYVTALGEELQAIAERHLLGSTNKEIAVAMGFTERTIIRKLNLIRAKWAALARDQV
jgi:DNA-directed RNA polymerase specialized sigma24 family protein